MTSPVDVAAVLSKLPSGSERTPVETFPSIGPSDNGSSKDMSAGKLTDIPALVAEEIEDRKRLRRYRAVTFYGSCALIIATFGALLYWLHWVTLHMLDANLASTYSASMFMAPVVVLATLSALLVLALLKFAFRMPEKSTDDEPSPISLMTALGVQAIDLLKTYLGKKA